MTASNKFNVFLSIVLALIISLGCNLISSDTGGTNGEAADRGNSSNGGSDDDELAIEITDENVKPAGEETSETGETGKTSGSNRTVVKFGQGKTSAAYDDAVIRGEQHTYVLGASAGQNMTVSISSLEDNASFYILSPKEFFVGDGTPEDGTTNFRGALPESGNYKIVVSPTRGNATYKINFAVSAKAAAPPPETGDGGRTTVVKFAKGRSSASYSNAVIRGERDTYILGAGGGQTMNVSISSLEDNAVFDIVSPAGATLASERTSWSGNLPQDGKYRVIVGGTRGNASYTVNFSIR